ncbi:hypothetical protein BDV33DRAFT_194313 [Aspergillus novoparasiticus]|uniref:HECT domain-containing protein n=1 Tax=Aspergillus novoparasiticus TaxID=986946 RepID=A0A5N6EG13_9EURO|nr:hypothetical protein BDV33DRAFT_194313 [Aspergillus novoparasiticus]
MAESESGGVINGLGKTVSQLEKVVSASLRPLPTETGDGSYVKVSNSTGIVRDLGRMDLSDVKTIVELTKNAATGEPLNDKHYIMERLIQLTSALPSNSRVGKELTNAFLNQLWKDLEHPPVSYLGREYSYREADGSGNNVLWPHIGAAGSHYARSVRPKTLQSPALPDPETLFDSLLARKDFKEHPNKISSILFYIASIIIHDLFQTDRNDATISLTSSYLDLSPLYGNNQDEQNLVRTFKDGKLKPDCFSTKRVLGFPPGIGVILIMFNRFHNYVVEQLASINEGGRFTKPDESDTKAYARYDNDLFQTGRLVTCGLYVNIILKDYVRTILNVNRTDSLWSLDPRAEMKDGLLGEAAAQATGNQVSAEFNLVYRWHSCISQRDEKWTEDLYKDMFPGRDPSSVSLQEFVRGLGKWEADLPEQPEDRPFAGLQRKPDGSFDDDSLVKIFEDSVEDCVGAFGASNVPTIFKSIEALGIKQARSWNLATLNEFRNYFNLTPYKTFEEINPDPVISDQLKRLYDHPDHVEIYPGVIVEDTKETVVPGSGLCTNFTISRAILSDAVALVRGDRFYTVDFTPRHLTNWAFSEIEPKDSVDQGHVFYKLVLRAFPNHFKGNSIYAHLPLVIPSENKKILTKLGFAEKYNWDKPGLTPPPEFINSHSACMSILSDQETFKVTWGSKIEFLMHRGKQPFGRDFMLSGDRPPNSASRKMMGAALYRKRWENEVKSFYEDITLKLLHRNSYKIAGINQVDIVRDVANPAQVNFCANVFSLPLKTESNPRGIFTESELYQIMAVVFTSIFYDADPANSFELNQAAREVTQQLGQLAMANVELVNNTGFIANLVSSLHRHDVLSEYGVHMIQRLLGSGLPAEEVVWTHILPTAGGMVANQAQLFSQCLDYYLSEEGSVHLPDIKRLAKVDTPETDELLLRYFMEGARLRSSVGLPRMVTKPTVIEDNGKKLNLKAGQHILCNLVSASMDPTSFPEPEKVRLDRDMDLYAHFGFGPHQCLGIGLCKLALTTMLKVIGRLDNLRRAPGPQGQLKKLSGPGGIAKYMNPDQSGFSPFPTSMKIQWDVNEVVCWHIQMRVNLSGNCDLYHWINVLNRFDEILAAANEKYGLNNGPQTKPFGRHVLVDSYASDDNKLSPEDMEAKLTALGYGVEGDRELLQAILDFSRLLLDKCGNRSLYSSSERLGELLNTTSLCLLQSTLRLSLSLAQRYHSRQRGSTHLQQSLLAAHFNIDLEKLQKIAAPFPRPSVYNKTPVSPPVGVKGKEKQSQTKHDANDMVTLVRESDGWEEWGHVHLLYYPSGTSDQAKSTSEAVHGGLPTQAPTTPTPLRRSHTHPTPRLSRTSIMEDSPSSAVNTPSGKLEEATRGGKVLDIPYSRISSSTPDSLVSSHAEELPEDSKYELLHRIRTAQGLATSPSSREQILAIRVLAITNLAYVYPESLFQQKILQIDMEQPKRLQLAYQLGELVHLGASGDLPVSRGVQTLVLQALDSLAKHKARAIDVCAALSVNVNHGVLMFLTRKAVNELGSEDKETDDGSQDEWRDALLALLRTLPGSSTRTPETLVSAGLIPMFVDVLNLRTEKARRVYSRIMEFLDTFVHAVRDALGTLTTAKGFDAISDLIDFETKTSFENVSRGAGIPSHHKTPSIDYQIPYFQQQTLRWMFRFVNHIMQHNGNGFDRVLRNLIDSPQLLTSLRLVFENARVFGSHVWSNAVNILSSFIHNEPTSYAVIAEAGLSKSFLQAVTNSEIKAQEKLPVDIENVEVEGESSTRLSEVETSQSGSEPQKTREYELARSKDAKLALGIMPAAEALSCIPSAFGAICLNSSGLELFQSSHALESFFEIFENPEHVKCLKDDPNLVRSLGTTFDELVRHHPALKSTIMAAVIVMVARVGFLCRSKAWSDGMGSKLWTDNPQGKPVLSGPAYHLFRKIGGTRVAGDLAPSDLGIREIKSGALPDGGTMKTGDLGHVLPASNTDIEPKDVDSTGLTVTDYLYPVLRFLGAFFENQSNCTYFVECGGVEFVLDIATLQSLPFDFHNTDANQELTVLVHMLAETKPHLVLPGLVDRAEQIVEQLSEFWRLSGPRESGFFTPLIKSPLEKESKDQGDKSWELAKDNGTYFAKNMVAALILTDLLREVYSMPLYQTRPSQQTSAFAQVNLADRYCSLIGRLGGLHAACVWEEILLEKNIPDTWDQATKVQLTGAGSEKPNESSGPANAETSLAVPAPPREGSTTSEPAQPGVAQEPSGDTSNAPESSVAFKNVQALRYLLSSLPSSITGFFHNLGLGLIGKRRIDLYQKQNATSVAEAIAGAVLEQLQFAPPNTSGNHKLRFAYLIVILSSFSHLLFEATADRPHSHYLTLVLFAFKRIHGLKAMKDICDVFVREVKTLTPPESVPDSEKDVSARLTSAYGGIKIILSFFSELASGKNIVESSQTQAMTSSDRERDRPDYFQPGQFLVDLRMEILPMARDLWNSDFATQSSSSVIKCLVDILRSSLDGEYETGAAQRSNLPPALAEVSRRKLVINRDRVAALQAKDFDLEVVTEALYRCNNQYAPAEEYCKAQDWLLPAPRIPPPPNDIESVRTPGGETSEDQVVGDASPFESRFLDRSTLAMLIAQASGRSDDMPRQEQGPGGPVETEVRHGSEFLARALSHILNDDHSAVDSDREDSSSSNTRNLNPSGGDFSEPSNHSTDPSPEQRTEQSARRREVTTVEDLDKEREKVRSNLIERCLDVLNEHHDVSFELADLIASATKKHRDPESFRKEVGEILVQSLVSLQMENFQAAGKKVAAYAHLLALVVQDRDMYNATLEELKECFTTFLGFISVPSEKSSDESFPWIGHVLLVLEKLLSDDAQPPQIRWNMPDNENPGAEDDAPAQLEEPLISNEQKTQLFEALVEILPRVGKDDTLALSVCRVLVILTRNRSIATRLGEKRSLQRLFVMMKQLSSTTNEKLQGAFMLILRHIVEDEDTIRQIMRSEIVANFESKSSRQIDTTGYVRQMYHLVLRSPELFVEVSNEKLKLQRYDSRQRPQVLTLKSDKNTGSSDKETAQDTTETAKDGSQTSADAQPEDKDKGKGPELKPPVVENPDGVVHYLLSELLSYKDVDDKEPSTEATETSALEPSETQTDVEMATDEHSPSISTTDLQATRTTKKAEKPAFKADDHPIYIYRCFLLQCLTELLSSYNRTKVEFINFSRKADPLAATPSKPRSGILNYLLNALVPIGTMEHDESVVFKKRANTSAWTMRVLVALCTKTGEFGGTGRRRSEQNSNEEDEPELAFVRSETSDISTLGETEEDEISSATSVSDLEDDREETPDLFRHSTLGMLEPRHEEETSSEESDEEDDGMYDDEYEDEMDYEEDLPEDDGEVVSDEEDEIEGVGPIEGLPGDSGMDIEVVIDDDEDDDDEDDDDEDEDDSDMEDDEILAGEITGDQDNESLEEGDDDEWESEEMSEDDEEAEIMNRLEDELEGIRQVEQRQGQRFDDLFRVLNEAAGGVEDLQAPDSLDDIVDDDLNDDDEDEEIDELEEELEDADEDQGSYQGFDDDEDLIEPWGWDGDEAPIPRGHHHHRYRGPQPGWAAVTGIMPSSGRHGIVPIQPYRFHRTQVPARGNDDGTNPLLVRTDRGPEAGQSRGPGNEAFTDWVHGMEPVSTGRLLPMDSPALPEELREEVIMQQLAEQRSQAAAAGEEPSEINPEFLEALPPEIREELLQQEAADRRRRERESARRQAASGGAPPRAEDMDAASFLATLDPSLRQAVLADQPEEILATLGPEFVTEARALPGRRLTQFGDIARVDHRQRNEPTDEQEPKKQQRRQIVQMLDKAGVATLLRLMFMPLQGNARHQLNDILHNVCENRQNRVEVISLLLSVLQDGSSDVSAIERSFAQLSLRAKPPSAQKTPQPVKRNLAFQTSSSVSNEVTPTMVVQQCLGTLSFLSQYNPHIAWFFLTEHDPSSTLKLKAFRKGKGKENKANKFALNALLTLLDRKLIMESPNCMEQLSSLLSSITQPLTLLSRREKEKQEEEDKGKKPELAQDDSSTEEQQQQEQQQQEQQQQEQPSEAAEPTTSATDTTMTDAPLPSVENTEAPSTMAQPEEGTSEPSKSETGKGSTEDEKHKKKSIEPPVVPDHNLQLVVHILAARECNGKTFRETLSTINNLSAIPKARDVIGNELVHQAQDLSTTILTDLDELSSHINQARTGTDMQGLALAKFSPASSDQAKLLRVLTALDYLFDPSRSDKAKGGDSEQAAKENVLQTLYESSTFGPLWTRLSECLTLIRHKENMLNVATILLPLIEALMVVCKNTSLKETPLSRNARELSVSSTSVGAGLNMESLFFKFTEEHRKILNELVRQNPRLMSGTFSLLVKNPKVLEFDNKRNYFTRRIHSRGAEPRHPHPPLQLSVRRDQVFLDSFKSLYFKSADELKYGKLNVRFHGEEGVDAGGVTREWFQVLARGMFNPNYALFIPVAADRTTFHPNRLSGVNSEHLMFFKFIGRIIGKALYEGRVLDCHFSRAVYKCILGRSVSIKDMETLDLDYYKSLLWMLENDITDIITETFAVETDDFGEKQVIDLVENGSNIPVTQENKEEYVQRVVDYRLVRSVKEQLDNFLKGFHEIIPADLISIFNEQELELLISGLPEIDVDDWKTNTEYHNYSASSPQIQWFWRAVRSFDKEERAKLLQFVTGTSKVPLNGFKELEGMNGVSRFNIHRDYGNKDRLPSAHTCFNQLDLPEYDSYETLRQRLYTAMTAGSEYFGFA